MPKYIRVIGATQNNLKNIHVDLPLGKLIALVGPSGCGKSSLAFETLFAESRRRFLDCLSASARRLLARPDKPAVEAIESLPPALCLVQRVSTGQSRSLLASLTECLDYLRIIYAAIGLPHDPSTGEALTRLSAGEIAARLGAVGEGTRLTILAPLPMSFSKDEASRASDVMDLQKLGYLRLRVQGELLDIEDFMSMELAPDAICELVIDRVVCKETTQSRIADSVQAALRQSPDELRALIQLPTEKQGSLHSFYTRYRNDATGFTLPDLSPQSFSHYSPKGACEYCRGLGFIEKVSKAKRPKKKSNKPEEIEKSTKARDKTYSAGVKKEATWKICPHCKGMRLNDMVLAITLRFGDADLSLGSLLRHSVDDLLLLLPQMELAESFRAPLKQACADLQARLTCLQDLGLGYLSLDRATNSLSGGELQRARLAAQIGGGLTGVLYILDEPTIGLYPRETECLIASLKSLRDKGNTVLVIEHDPLLLAAADYIIEMGPGSGPEGGEVLCAGSYDEIYASPLSPTGAWLRGDKKLAAAAPLATDAVIFLELKRAKARNIKGLRVRFPLGRLTCLSGPSGSGKSTLVHECLLPAFAEGRLLEAAEHLARVVVVDQSPLGSSARSTPATATGLLDVLRPLFAALPLSRQRGYTPSRFSLNIRGGRCERCMGTGFLQVDMSFLADLYTPCDACLGARYNRETLEVTWRGKSIAELLEMSVREARVFFRSIPPAHAILSEMEELGLGYLQLNRASSTLSGGEAQRVKLAKYLSEAAAKRSARLGETKKILFILDEPSTGLHFAEVDLLLRAFYRLRAAGHTLLCIEHHQGILERADYLIEMGPGSGEAGGKIVKQGWNAIFCT